MTTTLSEFHEKLDGSRAYKKYKSIVQNIASDVNTEQVIKDTQLIHKSRLSRTLRKQASPVALQEASLNDLTQRSRLIEMRVALFVHMASLKLTLKQTAEFLSVKYAKSLKGFCGTAQERKAAIDIVLQEGITLQDSMQTALDVIDMVVKDIDQGGYGLKNSIEVVKMLLGKPGQEVV